MGSMILMAVIKYIVATAILYLFYLALFKGKSSFIESRIYLLTLPFIALLLTQFSIVVYTPDPKIVERIVTPQQQANMPELPIPGVDFYEKDGIMPVQNGVTPAPVDPEPGMIGNVSLISIFIVCYVVVTVSLFIVLLIGIVRIIRLKRKSEVIHFDNYEIVVSEKVISSFSFFRSIYIGSGLSDEKLDIVMCHEKWHILHRHYIDLIIVEFLSRLMWFNPFVWCIRREIRNIHEFQTDRNVIDEGHNIVQYQMMILEDIAGKIPYAVNAFNNSFTKKGS